MGRPRSALVLEQHPFVNVFKLPVFETSRKLHVKGDVAQITDPTLHRRVWILKGDISSNNALTFPKDASESLMLAGRFVYILLKPASNKVAMFHLEVTLDSGPAVRISFSTTFTSVAANVTQLKLPLPDMPRWTVMAVDLESLMQQYYPKQPFKNLKAINMCSNLSVRTVLTSMMVYTYETLPYEAAFPIEPGQCWTDLYDWYWLNRPSDSDPAEKAPRPLHQMSRQTAHGSARRTAANTTAMTPGQQSAASTRWVRSPPGVTPASGFTCNAQLAHVLQVNDAPVVFGRGKRVLWAAASTIVEMNTETRVQRFLGGGGGGEPQPGPATSTVHHIFADHNIRVLGSLSNTPPTMRLWDLTEWAAGGTVPLGAYMTEVHIGAHSDTLNTVLVVGGKKGMKKTVMVMFDTSDLLHPALLLQHKCDTAVRQAVFLPSEPSKFVTCDGTPTLKFWRVRDAALRNACVTDTSHHHNYTCVAFEPTHRNLPNTTLSLYAGTAEGYAHVIDYHKMTITMRVRVHQNAQVNAIVPCGGLCATGGSNGVMRLWPLDFASFLIETDLTSPVRSLDISRDGLVVACLTEARCISVLDFPTRNLYPLIQSHPSRILAAKFHPTRACVATVSADAAIRIWGTHEFECIGQYDCKLLAASHPSTSQHSGGVAPMETTANTTARAIIVPVGSSGLGMPATLHTSTAAFTQQSTRAQARRSELGLTDKTGANTSVLSAHTTLLPTGPTDVHPLCMDWSRDETTAVLAVGFTGGTIRVFDVDHRCVLGVYTPHESDVEAVLYTANRLWLTSMDAYAICFADVRHGYHVSRVCRLTYPTPHVALTESEDGRYLATLGPNGNTLHFYEAERGFEIGTVTEDARDPGASRGCWTDVAFGSGNLVVAATSEGHIVQWRLPDDLPLPPEPEELDYGVPAPVIQATRVGRFGGGRLGGRLTLSDDRRWALGCSLDDGTTPGTFSVAPLPAPTLGGALPPVFAFHDGTFTAAAWAPAAAAGARATLMSVDSNGAMAFWTFHGSAPQPEQAVSGTPGRGVQPPPQLTTPQTQPPAGRYGYAGTPQGVEDATLRLNDLDVGGADVSKAVPPSQPCDPDTLQSHELVHEWTEEVVSPGAGGQGGSSAYAATRHFPFDRVRGVAPPAGEDDENVPAEDQSGLTPVAAWGSNASTVDAVATTAGGCVITASGGVVRVEDLAEIHPAMAAGDGQLVAAFNDTTTAPALPKSLRLLMNDGFVSTMSVSHDEAHLAVALYYSGGERSRLVVWCLLSYECLANVELQTACVHSISWSPKVTKQQAPGGRTATTASLCALGYSEVIAARFTDTGDVTAQVLEFERGEDSMPSSRYSHVIGLLVHGGFCLVGGSGMAVVTLPTGSHAHAADAALQRFSTPYPDLQCCVESPRSTGLVWAGGCNGHITAWITGATHAPVLHHRHMLQTAAPIASLVLTDEGTRMYACTSHGHALPAITVLAVVEDAGAGRVGVHILEQIDMKLGIPRCVPRVCRVPGTQRAHLLFALADGGVYSIPAPSSGLGDIRSGAFASATALHDKPSLLDAPPCWLAANAGLLAVATHASGGVALYDAVDGSLLGAGRARARVNAIAIHHRLGVVTVEADGCLAVIGLDAGGLRERHRFKLSATALTGCAFTSEDDVLVADSVGGVYAVNLMERDAATVVCDPDEPADTDGVDASVEGTIAAEGRHGVAFSSYLNHPAATATHAANATLDTEGSGRRDRAARQRAGGSIRPDPRRMGATGGDESTMNATGIGANMSTSPEHQLPQPACTLRTATLSPDVTLHFSRRKNCLTVLRAVGGEDGGSCGYDVAACFVPTEKVLDASLTSDGQEVVYLLPTQLIVLNYHATTVTRVLHLPRPCTTFALSPDNVFAVCWGGAKTPRLLLIDYEFATVQEIEGHVTPPARCAFARDGLHMFSVSGTAHDFELMKWEVRQLVGEAGGGQQNTTAFTQN